MSKNFPSSFSSKEVLKNALMKYDGTLLIVSHDRDFLQGLTNRVFEFRNGKVKQHIGDVSEYITARKIASLKELEEKEKKPTSKPAEKKDESKDEVRHQEKEIKQLQNQLSKSEKIIEELEQKIKSFDEKLMDPEQYKEATTNKQLFNDYENFKKQLEAEMKKWEELQGKMENFK